MKTPNVFYLIGAVVSATLIPFAPGLLSLRIRILKKLHLNWFADMHEKHFPGWVMVIRVFLAAGAALLLWLAIR